MDCTTRFKSLTPPLSMPRAVAAPTPITAISPSGITSPIRAVTLLVPISKPTTMFRSAAFRSEEHTSELQSRENLVCRLLLEKKKDNDAHNTVVHTTQPIE